MGKSIGRPGRIVNFPDEIMERRNPTIAQATMPEVAHYHHTLDEMYSDHLPEEAQKRGRGPPGPLAGFAGCFNVS
jgi:hypothetical protein